MPLNPEALLVHSEHEVRKEELIIPVLWNWLYPNKIISRGRECLGEMKRASSTATPLQLQQKLYSIRYKVAIFMWYKLKSPKKQVGKNQTLGGLSCNMGENGNKISTTDNKGKYVVWFWNTKMCFKQRICFCFCVFVFEYIFFCGWMVFYCFSCFIPQDFETK